MKKIALAMILCIAAMSLFWCSGKSSDDSALLQMAADSNNRITALENRMAELEAKIAVMEGETLSSDSIVVQKPLPEDDLSEEERIVFDVMKEYINTDAFHKASKNGGRILQTMEYKMKDLEGFFIDAVFIYFEADEDMFGYDAGMVIVDRPSGEVFDRTVFNGDFSIPPKDHTEVYSICASGYDNFLDGSPILWSETEYYEVFSQESIDKLNDLLTE